jgi:hypothetical protein
MKVIVGLVPVGRITDSSASGPARAVAERVSRELCSPPLDGVFEIGTTVDARQGIGAEVLIVVSPVVDGGIDTNLSAFLRSTEMLAPMLPVCYRDSISPRRPTPASRRRVARFLIPSLGAPSPRIAV